MKKKQSNINFILILFSISFLVRILFCGLYLFNKNGQWVCHDSLEYNNVASQMAQGNGISNLEGEPDFYRVPGYSIFLASCYKIFGFDEKIALWFQIFLSSFIPILIFYLSLMFFPCNILLAKMVSLFLAVHLGFIMYSGMIMSESLFLLFLLFFSLLFFSSFNLFFCEKKQKYLSYKKLFLSGLFLGILSLIRPVGHYILVISILLLLFSNLKLYEKIKANILFFLGWLLIVFGWLLRNYMLAGGLFFHAMPGYHFLVYFAAEVDSQAQHCSYSESKTKLLNKWQDSIKKQVKEKGRELSVVDKGQLAQELAANNLKKTPFLTIKHAAANLFKTLFSLNSAYLLFIDTRTLPTYNQTTSLWNKVERFLFPETSNKFLMFLIYFEIIFLAITLFGFLGFLIISLFRKKLLCELLKILPLIGLLVLLTFGSGVARLRLPVEPFLIIFAFYFWFVAFRKSKEVFGW